MLCEKLWNPKRMWEKKEYPSQDFMLDIRDNFWYGSVTT